VRVVVEMPPLVEIPHEEVVAAVVTQCADLGQHCGGPDTRVLLTADAEMVSIRVDHAGPVFGDPLDALRGGGAGVSLDGVERQAEAA
jgi:hypothetical protein